MFTIGGQSYFSVSVALRRHPAARPIRTENRANSGKIVRNFVCFGLIRRRSPWLTCSTPPDKAARELAVLPNILRALCAAGDRVLAQAMQAPGAPARKRVVRGRARGGHRAGSERSRGSSEMEHSGLFRSQPGLLGDGDCRGGTTQKALDSVLRRPNPNPED